MTLVCFLTFTWIFALDLPLILPARVSTLPARWIYDIRLLSDIVVCSGLTFACLTTLTFLRLELFVFNKQLGFFSVSASALSLPFRQFSVTVRLLGTIAGLRHGIFSLTSLLLCVTLDSTNIGHICAHLCPFTIIYVNKTLQLEP